MPFSFIFVSLFLFFVGIRKRFEMSRVGFPFSGNLWGRILSVSGKKNGFKRFCMRDIFYFETARLK